MKAVLGSPRARLLLGALLISFSSVFAKLATVPPTVSAFYRVAIGGVVLAAFMLWKRWPMRRQPPPWILLGVAAVFLALDLGFWHHSIHDVGPGLSTLLASFQVFFMALAGVLFFRQKLSIQQWIAIPLALIGLSIIVGLDWTILAPEYRRGVLFGLLTAATYAAYLVTLRQTQIGGAQRLPVAELAVISLATAAFLATWSLSEGHSLAIGGGWNAFWLVCYGLFCHVCGWLCIASSLPRLTTAVAGLTLTLQPTLTFLWDVLFFGRGLQLHEALGALLAVGAVYLGSRGKNAS